MERFNHNLKKDRIDAPIGVFDSGVGGLTVAREIIRNLPQERIVYFGDTARVPYGSKSKDTILKYSRQIIRFLRTKGVKAIVVACNTASALALEEVKKEMDIPIIGVIEPGAKVAVETTRNGKIGVIGTEATVRSHVYSTFIHEKKQGMQVLEKACPLFVPLVEEGLLKDPVTIEMAGRYLKEIKNSGIDTLILGCTHYPLLRSTVGEIMGDEITLVNPAYETARGLWKLLIEEGIAKQDKSVDGGIQKIGHEFYVSDAEEKFMGFARSILPNDIEKVNLINIEEY
jgi:glutamate racemase